MSDTLKERGVNRRPGATAVGTDLGRSIRIRSAIVFAVAIFFAAPYELVPPGWSRVLVPLLLGGALWLALFVVWQVWHPDRDAEVRFGRAVAGAVAGMFFVASFLATQEAHHVECTRWVRTRDERICVGDDVLVPGPDLVMVLFLAAASAPAFWLAVAAGPWADDERSSS